MIEGVWLKVSMEGVNNVLGGIYTLATTRADVGQSSELRCCGKLFRLPNKELFLVSVRPCRNHLHTLDLSSTLFSWTDSVQTAVVSNDYITWGPERSGSRMQTSILSL